MFELTKKAKSFHPELPLQLAWDSTSLRAFLECPRKYYYRHVQGWQPREEPAALLFGRLLHKFIETHYKCLYEAQKGGAKPAEAHETAVHETLRRCLPLIDEARLDEGGDTKRSWETLIRSYLWWTEHYKKDPFRIIVLEDAEGNSTGPAVELSFSFPTQVKSSDGHEVLYCGHLDAAGEMNDELYVIDTKSTTGSVSDSFQRKFDNDIQMSGYHLGASLILGEPVAAVLIDTHQVQVNNTYFYRFMTYRSEAQSLEFIRDFAVFFSLAETFARRAGEAQGEAASAECYPMNRSSCTNYGGCDFLGICSKDPNLRRRFLKGQFEQKALWDPLVVRE